MSNTAWHPPLPPGWEARWDPNQRAFFFINHVNKTTTWEDPRWSNKQTLATSSGGHTSHQGETIPMRDMSQSSPRRSPTGQRSHSPRHSPSPARVETTFTNQREADNARATMARLKARFPDAGPVIEDVLNMCQNNEDDAAAQLMQLGFESSDTQIGRSPGRASPAHSRGGASASASPQRGAATPKKKSTTSSPARQATPKISEREKKNRLNKMCKEFKTVERDVVKMALEAHEYDEQKTRMTLGNVSVQWQAASESRGEGNRSGSSSRAGSAGSARNTTPAHMPAKVSVEPVVFSSDSPAPTSSTGTSSVIGKQKKPTHPRHQQQRRAKEVTKMSEQLLTTTNDMLNHLATSAASCCPADQHSSPSHSPSPTPSEDRRSRPAANVVTSQPQAQPQPQVLAVDAQRRAQVHHGSSGLANGPDSSIRVGADSYLRSGPNPEFCMGPDPDFLLGPSMEAEGHNPEYHFGNQPDLATGSSGAAGPNPALRCSAEQPSPFDMGRPMLQTSI